ncbi:MAG: hypothetical protein WD939_02990 [Dehalococcoidia bacterium]
MISPLRILAALLSVIVVGTPIAAFAFFLMAIIGDPGTCASGERTITVSPEAAASFQAKWDELDASLDAGQAASTTVTEDEATSRARAWLEERDAPISEALLCFSADGGSASAKVDVPFFPGDVDVLVRGTLLLTGEQPQAQIDDIEMGGMPGFMTEIAERFINRVIDNQTDDLALEHDYGLAFDEGEATVGGQP